MSQNNHVRVVVRTRPTQDQSEILEVKTDQNIINIRVPKSENGGIINNQNQNWSFKLDRVLPQIVSQDSIYEECARPIVQSALDGYNGTILVYGQTGAGKTYTMTGTTDHYNQRGIIPRVVSQIFHEIQDRSQYTYTVRISYLEIYNEHMVDLLAIQTGHEPVDLNVVDDTKNGCVVKGLCHHHVLNEEEALNLVFEGMINRSTGTHALNSASSRSHAIFTVHLECQSNVDSSNDVIFSKLNLVDLAGSERLAKTNSTGKSFKEATFINKSLTFLEQCIVALADKKRDHVPFRQSKLTNVLRDSLGGNCKTIMIANIWGESAHVEETISTLRFATRMMCITNEPIVNVRYDPQAVIKKQEKEILDLRQELAMHDALIGRSHIQYEPYTDLQKLDMSKSVKAWLDGKDDSVLEITTLRHAKEIISACKAAYCKMQQEFAEQADSGPAPNNSSAVPAVTDRQVEVLDDDTGVGESEGTGFSLGIVSASGPKKKIVGKKGGMSSTISNTTTRPSIVTVAGTSNNSSINNTDGSKDVTINNNSVLPLSTISSNPALGSQLNVQTPLPPIPCAPTRNEAFEIFKKGAGIELATALVHNKEIMRAKCKQLSETNLAETNAQARLDQLNKETEAQADTQTEEIKLLTSEIEKLASQTHNFKVDIEHVTQLVNTCREKLLNEFEIWFGSVCDFVDNTNKPVNSPAHQPTIDKPPGSTAYFNALQRNANKPIKNQQHVPQTRWLQV